MVDRYQPEDLAKYPLSYSTSREDLDSLPKAYKIKARIYRESTSAIYPSSNVANPEPSK